MNTDRFSSKNWFLFGLPAIFFFLFGWSLFEMKLSDSRWQARVKQYEQVSDSLGKVVHDLDAQVKAKDKLMVAYLESLDQSIRLLDRAQVKNKIQIEVNQRKRDSIWVVFCEEMKQLNSPSEVCK